MYVYTFNVQTLFSDEKITKLKAELQNILWSNIGLSKVRRFGEGCIKLNSADILVCRENETNIVSGVGFLIHKNITQNIKVYQI